ncbi:MAG: hypothetical protein JXA30_13040 [Deltaproteobacteria bacterium]|nr:hypothetical protein [Deltaproteobacteria bacterium]
MKQKMAIGALLLIGMFTVSRTATAQENPSGEMPTHTGKGKVTEAVDTKKGAIFDIGGGITILLPQGLPVGSSRVLTLKKAPNRPKPTQIHKRFQRYGETVIFTGALGTAGKPIVLSMSVKKSPQKSGYKLVLAIEEAGLCSGENKKYNIGKGLCSVWRTVDAEYDASEKRVVAKLTSTGGHRLQFGWIPETE